MGDCNADADAAEDDNDDTYDSESDDSEDEDEAGNDDHEKTISHHQHQPSPNNVTERRANSGSDEEDGRRFARCQNDATNDTYSSVVQQGTTDEPSPQPPVICEGESIL